MGIGAHAEGVRLHDVLDLAGRRVGNGGLQGEKAFQPVVVVDDIDIVDLVKVLGLLAHRLDAVGHRHVLVDDNHLGRHVTTRGILIILQQVHDVARLLHVVDVADDVLAVLLVKFLDHVDGVIGIHLLHLLGDFLVGHQFQQVGTLILIEFHQHVGGRLVIKQQHDEQGLLVIEVPHQFGNIGGMQVLNLALDLLLVLIIYQFVEV